MTTYTEDGCPFKDNKYGCPDPEHRHPQSDNTELEHILGLCVGSHECWYSRALDQLKKDFAHDRDTAQIALDYMQSQAINTWRDIAIAEARDSERNRVYAELRHFNIEFDGRKLMGLRKKWEATAQAQKYNLRKGMK